MTSQFEKRFTDENKILIQKILSGNLEYVQKTLSKMFSRGHFPNIRANGYGYRSMWQEEISQEIFIIFHKKHSEIYAPKTFIWRTVFYMSLKENNRLGKIYSEKFI